MRTASGEWIGGRYPETATLANALAHLGVVAPHTGRPYGEALLLGLGGGLGGGYFIFEFGGVTTFMLGFQHLWQSNQHSLADACRRLGAEPVFRETAGAKGAARHLDEALAAGQTPLAWLDPSFLPYYALPQSSNGCWYALVRVLGREPAGDRLLLDDRAPTPWPVEPADLAAARARIGSYKHRLLLLDPPKAAPDLPAAVAEAIRAGYQGLTEPAIKNFGLPAFAKWADLLTSRRDKKGWPSVFAGGRHLYQALVGVYHWIETAGSGGALRPLYAEFLEEAGQIRGSADLRALADTYRELGARWTAVARLALPDAEPALARTRALLDRRHDLLHRVGPPGVDELAACQRELAELERELNAACPLDPAAIDGLLAELADRVRALHADECAAAEAVRATVG